MLGCGSVLHLVQELAQTEGTEPPQLWLVTQGAQPVLDDKQAPPVAAAQASLWGFGRVIAAEHPEFWGGLIDLDPVGEPGKLAEQLHAEILVADKEDQLAFRGERRYVARLVRASRPNVNKSISTFRWQTDGSYLITGGLGDVGGHVARWMVSQGARRLILLGRSPIPPRSQWEQIDSTSSLGRKIALIRELEAMGASVHLASVDVADEAQLRTFLDTYRQEGWPPIRGVVHAAGILDNRLLLQLDHATLKHVLRSKVIGGWLLHTLLGETDLFLLFSSTSSILVHPGLSNYAAANAFLDALAHYRQAQNQTGLSINWGVWEGLGLLSDAAGQRNVEQMSQQGFSSLSLTEGLEALGQVLLQDLAQVMVVPIDWTKFKEAHSASRQSSLLTHLFAETTIEQTSALSTESGSPEISLRERLLLMEPEQRQELLIEHARARVAQVLKLSPSRIVPDQPLGSFGLDSLMAIEVRNRFEVDLGLPLSATLVWNYPTINLLVAYLLDKIKPPSEVVSTKVEPELELRNGKPEHSPVSDILANLDEISDEEALQALMSKGK
jgi:NAD(P)-dependent dehydrogenase (short-subunit alcohol dehydrogenase family)/acyl carrier protein